MDSTALIPVCNKWGIFWIKPRNVPAVASQSESLLSGFLKRLTFLVGMLPTSCK